MSFSKLNLLRLLRWHSLRNWLPGLFTWQHSVCVCVCVCVCACVRGNCRTLQRSESSIGCSSRMQHHTANVMPARLLGVFMFLLASAAPVLCRHAWQNEKSIVTASSTGIPYWRQLGTRFAWGKEGSCAPGSHLPRQIPLCYPVRVLT